MTKQNFSSLCWLGQFSKMMLGDKTSFSAIKFFLMNLSLPLVTSKIMPEKNTLVISFQFPKIITQCFPLQTRCFISTNVNFFPIPLESKSLRVRSKLSSISYRLMYFLSIEMKQELGRTSTDFGLSSFSFFFVLFFIIQNTFSSLRLYLTGRQKIKEEMEISEMVSMGWILRSAFLSFSFNSLTAFWTPCTVPSSLMILPSAASWTGWMGSPQIKELRPEVRKLLKMNCKLELDSSVVIFLLIVSIKFYQNRTPPLLYFPITSIFNIASFIQDNNNHGIPQNSRPRHTPSHRHDLCSLLSPQVTPQGNQMDGQLYRIDLCLLQMHSQGFEA